MNKKELFDACKFLIPLTSAGLIGVFALTALLAMIIGDGSSIIYFNNHGEGWIEALIMFPSMIILNLWLAFSSIKRKEATK